MARIERNIILIGIFAAIPGFYFRGISGAFGIFLGVFIAFINFKLIVIGIQRALKETIVKAPQRYLFFSGLKFLLIALFLSAMFYWFKPSIIGFIIGFSVFIPAILWETMFHINKEDNLGETVSDSSN